MHQGFFVGDLWEGLRDKWDPTRIWDNGGVLAFVAIGIEPIARSHTYTYEGGYGTGGGGQIGNSPFFGSLWYQERGPNQGLTGTLGIGEQFDSGFSIGISYTRNHSQATGYFGLSIGYSYNLGGKQNRLGYGSINFGIEYTSNGSFSGSLSVSSSTARA